MSLRFYKSNSGWVAADDGGWIPGAWSTKFTAWLGARRYLRRLERKSND